MRPATTTAALDWRAGDDVIDADALVEACSDPLWPVPLHFQPDRFVSRLGLPGADPEVRDIVAMLEAALQSAQETAQWELLGDALMFAHGRLAVRGLTVAGPSDVGDALADAAGLGSADEHRRLTEVLARSAASPVTRPREAEALAPVAAAYVEHLLRGDRAGAVALTRRCVTEGMDVSEVLLDVLEPAQHEVGRRWALGLISVIQEHFCTAVTQFVMTDLYPAITGGDDSERHLVAVHAPGSLHFVGLRMVTDLLECRGWSTTYVGDDISVETLIGLLCEERADLLLISASMPSQLPHLTATIRAVRGDPRTTAVKVVVGGRPFLVAPHLVDAIGADAWARDARGAVTVCNELVGGADDQR